MSNKSVGIIVFPSCFGQPLGGTAGANDVGKEDCVKFFVFERTAL